MSRRPRRLPFVISVALSATVACGGSTSGDTGDNQSDGGSGGAITGTGGLGGFGGGGLGGGLGGIGLSSGGGGYPPASPCPSKIPEGGTHCVPDSVNGGPYCDYDDPCGGADQIVATCTGVWDVPNADCPCECPNKYPTEGTACDPCIVDVCGWGDCSTDVTYSGKCVNGVWETEMHSCFPQAVDGGFPPLDGGPALLDSGMPSSDSGTTLDGGSP